MPAVTVGEQISEGRKNKGWTQDALASYLGVSRQAVAKWEANKALPGTANLFALSQILGIPLEQLRRGEEEKLAAAARDPPCVKEGDAHLSRRKAAVLWIFYILFLALGLKFMGIGFPLLVLLLSLAAASVLMGKRYVEQKRFPLKSLLFWDGFLLIGFLAALALWALAFSLRGEYHYWERWNIPDDQWREYSAIVRWVEQCSEQGDGVYAQEVKLSGEENSTIYLVLRCGVTDGKAGTIRATPLRRRFEVEYASGKERQAVDILQFQGKQTYQVFFSLDGNTEECSYTISDDSALMKETELLFYDLKKLYDS